MLYSSLDMKSAGKKSRDKGKVVVRMEFVPKKIQIGSPVFQLQGNYYDQKFATLETTRRSGLKYPKLKNEDIYAAAAQAAASHQNLDGWKFAGMAVTPDRVGISGSYKYGPNVFGRPGGDTFESNLTRGPNHDCLPNGYGSRADGVHKGSAVIDSAMNQSLVVQTPGPPSPDATGQYQSTNRYTSSE